MSSYYSRYCEQHGDWEQDIDRPGDECPECEKAGTTPMQLKDKRIRELEMLLNEYKDSEHNAVKREGEALIRAEAAEAEVARLKARACDEIEAHVNRRLAAESKLLAVEELVANWRAKREIPCVGHPGRSIHYYEKAADELEALLKGAKP